MEHDIWKDLTRVYSGEELHDAIIERCERYGINCDDVEPFDEFEDE